MGFIYWFRYTINADLGALSGLDGDFASEALFLGILIISEAVACPECFGNQRWKT